MNLMSPSKRFIFNSNRSNWIENCLYGVDKNTELETKLLKEFPEWQFSKEDLNENYKNLQRYKMQKEIVIRNKKLLKSLILMS